MLVRGEKVPVTTNENTTGKGGGGGPIDILIHEGGYMGGLGRWDVMVMYVPVNGGVSRGGGVEESEDAARDGGGFLKIRESGICFSD